MSLNTIPSPSPIPSVTKYYHTSITAPIIYCCAVLHRYRTTRQGLSHSYLQCGSVHLWADTVPVPGVAWSSTLTAAHYGSLSPCPYSLLWFFPHNSKCNQLVRSCDLPPASSPPCIVHPIASAAPLVGAPQLGWRWGQGFHELELPRRYPRSVVLVVRRPSSSSRHPMSSSSSSSSASKPSS